jgi:hypothetical protein
VSAPAAVTGVDRSFGSREIDMLLGEDSLVFLCFLFDVPNLLGNLL